MKTTTRMRRSNDDTMNGLSPRSLVPPRWLQSLDKEAKHRDSWPPTNHDKEFDWECPTDEAYHDPTTDRKFIVSEFRRARSRLDYNYHRNPALPRQELQDTILRRFIRATLERLEVPLTMGTSLSDENSEGCTYSCQSENDEVDFNARNGQTWRKGGSTQNQIRIATVESRRSDKELTRGEGRPWLVFTAGPMGVGKGYVLSFLEQRGLFPLHRFLRIDPDRLKTEIPEMSGYLRADPASAATKVHRESTQMADLLLEFAFSATTYTKSKMINASRITTTNSAPQQGDEGKCVSTATATTKIICEGKESSSSSTLTTRGNYIPTLVDGSLRDADYYKSLFRRIREETNYRIAIINITASPENIRARAKRRGEKTGRIVPSHVLEDSIRQSPHSVRQLSPLADATFTITNEDNLPLTVKQHIFSHSDQDNGNHCRRPHPLQITTDYHNADTPSSSSSPTTMITKLIPWEKFCRTWTTTKNDCARNDDNYIESARWG